MIGAVFETPKNQVKMSAGKGGFKGFQPGLVGGAAVISIRCGAAQGEIVVSLECCACLCRVVWQSLRPWRKPEDFAKIRLEFVPISWSPYSLQRKVWNRCWEVRGHFRRGVS